MTLDPEALRRHIETLRIHRHALVQTATPAEDGSLVPMLRASKTCSSIDVAIAALEEKLKEQP